MEQAPSHLIEQELFAYLDGEPAPEARRAVEAHLASCAACHTQVKAWTALFAQVDAAPDIPLQRDLAPAVLAALPARVRTPRLLPAAAALQAAVAVAVLAFAVPAALAQPEVNAWAASMQAALSTVIPSPDPAVLLTPLSAGLIEAAEQALALLRRPEALLESLAALIPLAVASSMLWLVGNTILLRRQQNGR